MDNSGADWNRTQRCGNYNNIAEPEYDVVDDQEEMFRVHILPARPIHDEKEYADRDLPRSSSAQSLSSVSAGFANIRPRYPPRETPHSTGPAINRDLKPGRRETKLDKLVPPVQPGKQLSHRFSHSPPVFASELVNRLAELALQDSCSREAQQKATNNAENHVHIKGSPSTASFSAPQTSQRHSLDLESQTIEHRSLHNLERVPSRRHHHEWPQTKEDFDQHDFVPVEKPLQVREEDWYVGACSRADAEHALHLVNKDGAFLVRDCSINTNNEPLVLVVYHEKKVYNVKIRFIKSTSKYALGTGQRSKDMFDSVADIIKFHSIFPIVLISGRNMTAENCVLTCPITKRDVDSLLQ
ncbi:cytokine-dependent hematopoietic cell linker [Parambassis ranga]|uniref:Cytokine-dependent hematopoietic cell linker n=1 Tax=Parambassis ranga TaxID=210632 RepID=A0A6P7J881_9TELE|nr:cytokine-dependent hematopoietic cell linker [Parambassis ranga]XP_028272821.1 cytokine-dependent hematopoietic cell linker [Parambassis ranga]XP_028272822.1 cytokine-dependent hematopoietic cell linker [Parambassis ranga]XP_028272824.1 cytokine-dependent hematopoietic cell linker [Parambassis ranga]